MTEQGLAYKAVMDLVSPLSMNGYHVYTDNYYTSLKLFADLKLAGFEADETVRKNRKELSIEFQSAKLTKGKNNNQLYLH